MPSNCLIGLSGTMQV